MVNYRIYLLDENCSPREVSVIKAECDAEALEAAKGMISPGGRVGLWGEPKPDIFICDIDDQSGPLVAAVVKRSTDM